MDPGRWQQIQGLFDEVVALDATERARRLAAVGTIDPELRAVVESLLAADAEAEARLAPLEAVLLAPGTGGQLERLAAALADRYRIERELGHGGMAMVYLAEDLRHRRKVAIKVLKPEVAAVLGVERFLREIEIAARLTHPHILPLHESGEAHGFLYYVMPYVEGESLRQRLDREKQLPLDDALGIAREVADALDYAHRHKLVHRDIKPENILLEERHAVVADFGIARAIDAASVPRLNETGISLGTPAYMSPEQVGGQALDGRSDLYSLGCVLYEMLAGQRPFTGTAEIVLRQHLDEHPPNVADLRPGVPPGVAGSVARALAKAPEDRFDTGAQLAEALERGVLEAPRAGDAVLSGPRRWRVSAAALAVAVVLALTWWGASVPGSRASGIRSLVVLPLDNLTGDAEQEYFADGMHEALIAELSKISALRVTSRTSAMRYKGVRKPLAPQIARELGVDGVIEGSVAREADQVQISVQLIHGRSDRHLWAETYQRELRGILVLQREVAAEIARQVQGTLTPADERHLAAARVVHPEAYDLYLRGRHFKHQEGLDGAWEHALAAFEQSVAIDSGFAPAWAGLAMMYAIAPGAVDARSRPAVETALALDPTLPDAYVSLALVRQFRDWDWKGAEGPLRRALELAPSNWEAHYEFGRLLMRLGRHDEALAAMQRALALDPFSITVHHGVCWAHVSARRYDEAIEITRRGLALQPNSALIQRDYADVLQFAGMQEAADSAWKRYHALCCGIGEAEYEKSRSVRLHRHVASGERFKALELLRVIEKERAYPPSRLGMLYVELGEKDEALRWLEQSVEIRDAGITMFTIDPRLDPVRGEPRFQALLKKVGLDQ